MLQGYIESEFPPLKRKEFTVEWQDEEGDMVKITSDSNLMTALNTMGADRNMLCKFFVTAK